MVRSHCCYCTEWKMRYCAERSCDQLCSPLPMAAAKESFLALLERLEKDSKPLAEAPSAKPKGKQPAGNEAPQASSEIPFHLLEAGRSGAVDVIATHPIPSPSYVPVTR